MLDMFIDLSLLLALFWGRFSLHVFSLSRLLLFESRNVKVLCGVSRVSGDEYMSFELQCFKLCL